MHQRQMPVSCTAPLLQLYNRTSRIRTITNITRAATMVAIW